MKFIKEHSTEILIAVISLIGIGTVFLPLLIAIARAMWQWALYGITI